MIAAAESASDYYRDPHVRARLLEYCGSDADHGPTAVYAAGLNPSGQRQPTWTEALRVPAAEFFPLCDRGFDVSRSLWDTRALIFVIDLDYQNLDFPSEPFTHASDVFFKLEPAYDGVRAVLRRFGIPALTLTTGRGYHFVGQIPLDDAVTGALAELAAVPTWLDGLEPGDQRSVSLPVSVRSRHGPPRD